MAVYTESRLRSYNTWGAALADVRKSNDAAQIEQIICAKIVAECVTAFEDLGALGDAIRHREKGGIFRRYLNAQPSQCGDFFDKFVLPHDVPNDPSITLETLLHLPALTVLAGHVSQEDYAVFQQSYRNHALNLFGTAKAYRDIGVGVKSMSNSTPAPFDSRDAMRVILELRPVGSTSGQKGGILPRTLNKIKHRFTLTERLGDYAHPGATDEIEYAALRPEAIGQLLENVVGAAGTMAEIAAFLIHLDAAGVTI